MDAPAPQPIVIIDDEKSFADMLGDLLGEHLDAPVRTFTDPEAAIASIPSLHPGVVVTDYYMPTINGLDLVRRIGTVSPSTPCILITGHPFDLSDHGDDGLQNLKGVLSKPFRWKVLAELIQQHWDGPNPPKHR
jgi:FixJ family two-component response regulator